MKTIINIFYLLLFIVAILALCYFSPVWVIFSIIIILLITSVLSTLYLISTRIKNGEQK